MPIVYAKFAVSFHGMTAMIAQLEAIHAALAEAAKRLHPDYPDLRFESDVEVELEEHAGNEEEP